jgi:hypothetical protein
MAPRRHPGQLQNDITVNMGNLHNSGKPNLQKNKTQKPHRRARKQHA